MPQLPAIYTIQASDAPQHLGKLQEILQHLKRENRIGSFRMRNVGEDLSNIINSIDDKDLILIVLTHQLESGKERIEEKFDVLKSNRPDIKIVEILVDQVPYMNTFITLPTDLRPIRDRPDMDTVWNSIEQNFREWFPKENDQQSDKKTDWSKYLNISTTMVKSVLVFILSVFGSFGILLVGVLGVFSGLFDYDFQNLVPLLIVVFFVALVTAFLFTKRIYEKLSSDSDNQE